MNENGRAPQSNGDFGLEEQLRLLPRPRMPAGLEERLLAAIPASRQATISGRCVAAGRSWPRPLPWAFGAVAAGALAAAAVLVAALILRRETPAPPGASRPAVASMSKEDIAAAVEREAMSAKWMASARALAFDLEIGRAHV